MDKPIQDMSLDEIRERMGDLATIEQAWCMHWLLMHYGWGERTTALVPEDTWNRFLERATK